MHLDEYRKLAAVEDQMWYFRALNRRMAQGLVGRMPAGPARVLDAGCGTGGLIRYLQSVHPDWSLTGLDFMPKACELARVRTGVEIVLGSITDLPFGDGEFDAVLAADVVCQVADGARALREFARCVRPGGTVVVNVPAYMWLWSYHDETCETQHRYTRPQLADHFRAAGLQVEFATYANGLSLPLIAARRKLFRPVNRTSDVRLYPDLIEMAFTFLSRLESVGLDRGRPLLLGSSVFVIGRKPTA